MTKWCKKNFVPLSSLEEKFWQNVQNDLNNFLFEREAPRRAKIEKELEAIEYDAQKKLSELKARQEKEEQEKMLEEYFAELDKIDLSIPGRLKLPEYNWLGELTHYVSIG